MTQIIGLTGGIGTGKTTVAKLFDVMGIPVYNTDEEAKRIMNHTEAVREKLMDRFGSDIYQEGKLNKDRMASLVFDNKENIDYVNSIVHPAVMSDFLQWTRERNHAAFLAIESAILFESGFNTNVDKTICVTAPLEIRIQRLMERGFKNKEAILNRIKNQMSEEERISRSDFIILNDNIKPLIPQIENIFKF